MTNTIHSTMTGSDVHEPKGVESALSGLVYVSNGSGSGSWTSIGASSFTGMIADFPWPVVQSGWLECNGSDVSTTTYSNLYSVMAIQTSGARTNGSPVITGISTTNLSAGFYVFGTGFAAGTTILSVDGVSQITVSNNASSSGTSALAISPWFLNTGTIRLPDLSTAGRFRRSRTAGTVVGQLQADQNKAHNHDTIGNTTADGAHVHSVTATTGTESATHTHPLGAAQNAFITSVNNGGGASQGNIVVTAATVSAGLTTGTESATHIHTVSGTTDSSLNHSHSINITSTSSGNSEARPVAIVMMTCVKT